MNANPVKLAVLSLALAVGCAGQVTNAPPTPDCSPGNADVVVIMAPAAVEIPECTETAVDEPSLNVGRRQWCCWKSNAPTVEEVASRGQITEPAPCDRGMTTVTLVRVDLTPGTLDAYSACVAPDAPELFGKVWCCPEAA